VIEKLLQETYNIRPETIALMRRAEADLTERFSRFSQTAAYHQAKILAAFHREGVSERHLLGTNGYGYDDAGREALDRIYASVFGTEAALVRQQFVSGTHALAACFFGLLRPGDTLLFATGTPYDTLEEVAGLRKGAEDSGSLADWGVHARVVDLQEDGTPDYEAIAAALDNSVKVVAMQRSRGYAWRNSLSVAELSRLIAFIKERRPDVIVMVDNCYGEFVEEKEPTEVGADVAAGSLIKNPGGGLAPTGGYIVGKRELIDKIACRLTAPGIGGEVGAAAPVDPAAGADILHGKLQALLVAVDAHMLGGMVAEEPAHGRKAPQKPRQQQQLSKDHPAQAEIFQEVRGKFHPTHEELHEPAEAQGRRQIDQHTEDPPQQAAFAELC